MRRALVLLIARTGRYFALLPAAIISVAFVLWLGLLDQHIVWFFVLGLVVPLTYIALALVLGMVFAGLRPPINRGLTRDEAPELWRRVEAAFAGGRPRRLRLFVSDELGASIGLRRSVLAAFGQSVFVEIGLPLMAALDERAFDAVLRHEAAHLTFRDINGATNTAEFYRCFAFVFDLAPPGETVLGTAAALGLEDFAALTRRADAELSREAELRADAASAAEGDAEDASRALVLISSAAVLMREAVIEPLELEVLRAAGPVASPRQKFLEAIGALRDPTRMAALWADALQEAPESFDTHPTPAQRVVALGGAPDPLPVLTESALDRLLPPAIRIEIETFCENAWLDRFE